MEQLQRLLLKGCPRTTQAILGDHSGHSEEAVHRSVCAVNPGVAHTTFAERPCANGKLLEAVACFAAADF